MTREQATEEIIDGLLDHQGSLSDGYELYLPISLSNNPEKDIREGLRPIAIDLLERLGYE